MYGTYESHQCVEAVTVDNSTEIGFVLTLNCIGRGMPAFTNGPPEYCYEGEAAEFELDTVHLIAEDGKHILLTPEIFSAIVGQEIETAMIEAAALEAEESGDF